MTKIKVIKEAMTMTKKKETAKTVTAEKKRYVVICTSKRGVFGGYLESYDQTTRIAKLAEARMCVYWSVETRGVLGLAAGGPAEGSRITPMVPAIELNDVTAIMDCTEEAATKWQSGIWS